MSPKSRRSNPKSRMWVFKLVDIIMYPLSLIELTLR